jgi:hypothetical protein
MRSHLAVRILPFLGLVCTFAGAAPADPQPKAILHRGAIQQGTVHVGSVNKETRFSLLSIKNGNGKTDERPLTGEFYAGFSPNRWRIAHGQLWLISSYTTIFSDAIYDILFRLSWSDLQKGVTRSGPEAGGNDPYHGFIGAHGSLGDTRSTSRFVLPKFKELVVLHYDYWPVSDDTVYLFLLTNLTVGEARTSKLSFRVSQYTGAWGPLRLAPKHKGWIEGKWKDVDSIEADFKEPFHAFMTGTTYFFVTESGNVYAAEKPAMGKRKLKPLWKEETRRVTAIVEDLDRKKTFLFGKVSDKAEENKGKLFYFELTEKPQPRYFDAAELKPVKAQEPLKTVAQFAQLLADKEKK